MRLVDPRKLLGFIILLACIEKNLASQLISKTTFQLTSTINKIVCELLGPNYWCASLVNAQRCGRTKKQCDRYGGIKNERVAAPKANKLGRFINQPVYSSTANKPSLVGTNPCTYGPSYWCASLENAKKCGLARKDCDKYGGIKNDAVDTPTLNNTDVIDNESPPGSDPCSSGPSYWCASLENVEKCGLAREDCDKYGGIENEAVDTPTVNNPDVIDNESPPGSDPCSSGPSYWCASLENVEKCGLAREDCDKYGGIENEVVDTPTVNNPDVIDNESPPGSDPCSSGPSYWCASLENVEKCGLAREDCDKYGGIENEAVDTPTVNNPDVIDNESPPGSDPCSSGPSYWCASLENVEKCGLAREDCDKYGGIENEVVDTPTVNNPDVIDNESPPGSDPCSSGPSYWCASLENVEKCGLAREDCDKYGGIENEAVDTPTVNNPDVIDNESPPGSDPCSSGPSYWCASLENVEKCGLAREDCDKYGGIENEAVDTPTVNNPDVIEKQPADSPRKC